MAQQYGPTPEAKTSIDSLLELLKEKGKMDLNNVSITLGVSPTIIEEWAKVLENGRLVKVSYEVGRMFLEPASEGGERQSRGTEMQAEAQRSALQSEMEVEQITLERYSKKLEDLSTTVAGMETMYSQRLPAIKKLFSELDSASTPMAKRMAELQETQKTAEAYFSQLDRRVDSIYAKINTFGGSNIERALRQKEETLKNSLARADSARAALHDLEDTRQALYSKISSDIDKQVKEYRAGLKEALDQIYAQLRADATEAVTIDKEIKTELAETKKTADRAELLKKDMELARAALLSSRNSFKDQYQKTAGEISQTAATFESRYQTAQVQIADFKNVMGAVSSAHDTMESVKRDMGAIQQTITAAEANVAKIIEQLKTIGTTREMDSSQKSRAVGELSRKSIDAKMEAERINTAIEQTEEKLRAEANEEAPPPPEG